MTIEEFQQRGQEPIFRKDSQIDLRDQIPFEIKDFQSACQKAGLIYPDKLVTRFVSSLLTKPFIILTGLSGSGKSKLAQAFVQWIIQEKSQYCFVPVGADWTNREPLLGYPNALKPAEYIKPDSGIIDLIIRANLNPKLPYFLVLDEMNLSLVERYFADFLSAMESDEDIHLYADGTTENGVPAKIKLPKNLFIIGTVNIDETTNMFSPKVLDRANTIEFRINKNEMDRFLASASKLDMQAMYFGDHKIGAGANMACHFIELARNKSLTTSKDRKKIDKVFSKFFSELQKAGAEFGYRTATDMLILINQLELIDKKLKTEEKIDIVIIQKLLPKLHGSRRKLSPILETLGGLCLRKPTVIGMNSNRLSHLNAVRDVFDKDAFDYSHVNVLYPLSLEKIARMYRDARDSGFASFAEA